MTSGPTGAQRRFVDFLVESDVLTFGDFTAKSGRRTPYFVNAGRFRTGAQLDRLGEAYADAVVASFGRDLDLLFGPAYKGIPLVVATAIALHRSHGLEVPIAFDRKEVKDHGEGGALVGQIPRPGDRVVIVEDVTTAGTSIRETVPKLRAVADVELVGLVVAVDRRERGSDPSMSALAEVGAEFGMGTAAIVTIDDIVAHLRDAERGGRRVLTDEDLARIEAYRRDYGVA